MGRDPTPAVLPAEDRMPLPSRLGILVLFLCGAAGGLWQYADPRLTAGVLAGAFLAMGVSFLPARSGWQLCRWGAQLALVALAFWWVRTRLKTTAIDLALIESTALLGLALLMEPPRAGYNVVASGSLIMIAYGGFIPLRRMYLPVAILFVATGVWMLYRTRAAGLAEQRTHTVRQLRTYRQERGFRAIHFFLFLLATAVIFALFPPGGRGGFGVFPVSFSVNESMRYPKLWKEWWQTPWAQEAADAVDMTDSGRKVRVLSPRAQTRVNSGGGSQAWESLDGGGAGTPGQALVFRVKCPEKLYWLVRIYDEYDGALWRSSRVSANLSGIDFPALAGPARVVDQFFALEKTGSPWLPGAFRVDQVVWEEAPESDTGAGNGPDNTPVTRVTPAGVRLESTPPPPAPWRYRCRSRLPWFTGDLSAMPKAWSKDAQRLLDVPPAAAAPRVRQLALRLTAQKTTPYRKALALRDYLRFNYRYSLTPPRPPPGVNAVEHFLFTSREGACAQSAQALTVLARLAGLPARLATGYAPGNYNVVSGLFEVHEYHAHAWCQILIPPYGWLTFDGVAPGNLQLQSLPPVLGKLRDPFDDTWEAGVPELARPGQAPAADANPMAPPADAPSRVVAAVEKVKAAIVARAQQETRTVMPDTKSLAKATGAVAWDALKHTLTQTGTQWRQWLRDLGLHLTGLWNHWLDALFGISHRVFAGMALTGALFLIGFLARHPVARAWGRWRRQRRCARAWSRLCRAAAGDPRLVVNHCYAFSSELLNVRECRRPGNQDLLEYGEWLEQRHTAGGADLMTIFTLFIQTRFGPASVTAEEAGAALAAARQLHARWQADGSDQSDQSDQSDRSDMSDS